MLECMLTPTPDAHNAYAEGPVGGAAKERARSCPEATPIRCTVQRHKMSHRSQREGGLARRWRQAAPLQQGVAGGPRLDEDVADAERRALRHRLQTERLAHTSADDTRTLECGAQRRAAAPERPMRTSASSRADTLIPGDDRWTRTRDAMPLQHKSRRFRVVACRRATETAGPPLSNDMHDEPKQHVPTSSKVGRVSARFGAICRADRHASELKPAERPDRRVSQEVFALPRAACPGRNVRSAQPRNCHPSALSPSLGNEDARCWWEGIPRAPRCDRRRSGEWVLWVTRHTGPSGDALRPATPHGPPRKGPRRPRHRVRAQIDDVDDGARGQLGQRPRHAKTGRAVGIDVGDLAARAPLPAKGRCDGQTVARTSRARDAASRADMAGDALLPACLRHNHSK